MKEIVFQFVVNVLVPRFLPRSLPGRRRTHREIRRPPTGIRAQARFLKNAVENVQHGLGDCLADGSRDGLTYFSAQAIKGMAEPSDRSN
jgi:hypothetical protein